MRVALLAVAAVAAEATQTVYTIPDKCAHAPCTRARATAARFVGKKVLSHSFLPFTRRDAFGASYAQFAAACMVLAAAFVVLAALSRYYCWLVRAHFQLGHGIDCACLSQPFTRLSCYLCSARSRCGSVARALSVSLCAGARNLR